MLLQTHNKYLILVTGGSCAGKTTLASVISDYIVKNSSLKPLTLNQDNYFLDFEKSQDLSSENFDILSAFDIELLIQNVQSILMGETAFIPEYDFQMHRRKRVYSLEYEPDILIVEGLFSFNIEELISLSQLRLFIELDSDLMLFRRIQRDVIDRGFTVSEIIERYFNFVKPSYYQLIYPRRSIANFILSGEEDFLAQLESVSCLNDLAFLDSQSFIRDFDSTTKSAETTFTTK